MKQAGKLNRLRQFLILAGAVMLAFVMSGCMSAQMEYTFHDDGTISEQQQITYSQSAQNLAPSVAQDVQKMADDNRKQGWNVSMLPNGYRAKRTVANIREFMENSGKLWQEDAGSSVKFRKGWLYDTYSIHLVLPGQENGMNQMGTPQNEWDAIGNQMMQSAVDSAKMKLSIALPYVPDAQNADTVSSDGKQLTWDLKPAVFQGQNKMIDLDFRIYHKNHLIILAVAGGLVVILSIICLVFVVFYRHNPTKRNFYGTLVVALVVLGSICGSYVAQQLTHVPQLTQQDRIAGNSQEKEAETNPAKDTAATAQQKSQGAADTSAQTTTKPTEEEEAQNLFVSYHQAITRKDYRKAYDLLAPQMRQHIGSYEDYAAGYRTTISSIPSEIQAKHTAPHTVELTYTLTARDQTDTGVKVQTFRGTAQLQAKGAWRITDIAAEKTGESYE